jgi:truncated hemoglobin YjbI
VKETLYERAGGESGLNASIEAFYSMVLADPILRPLVGASQPHRVAHLVAFTA